MFFFSFIEIETLFTCVVVNMGGKNRTCEVCGIQEKNRSGFFANFPLDENR